VSRGRINGKFQDYLHEAGERIRLERLELLRLSENLIISAGAVSNWSESLHSAGTP
jgi:aromatic ring hydroxylase